MGRFRNLGWVICEVIQNSLLKSFVVAYLTCLENFILLLLLNAFSIKMVCNLFLKVSFTYCFPEVFVNAPFWDFSHFWGQKNKGKILCLLSHLQYMYSKYFNLQS